MFRTLAAALLWISMGTHAWADDCAFGSPLEAKLMAEQAAAYLEKHGAERAEHSQDTKCRSATPTRWPTR